MLNMISESLTFISAKPILFCLQFRQQKRQECVGGSEKLSYRNSASDCNRTTGKNRTQYAETLLSTRSAEVLCRFLSENVVAAYQNKRR